jgi:hypothetical protein
MTSFTGEVKMQNHLRHIALLQDARRLFYVSDNPLDDDVGVINLDRVHDRLVDVNGQL